MNELRNLPYVTAYSITYNQKERVKETVEGLLSQSYPSDKYEIIILDDGSNDGTIGLLQELSSASPIPIKILTGEHQDDYLSAKLWNCCIAASSSQTSVFIQLDDVKLRSNLIHSHVKWHIKEGEFVVTGPKFEGDTVTWDINTCHRKALAGPNGEHTFTNYSAAWGASLSFTRRMINKIYQDPYDKPYDERMVGWGYHETEMVYRMELAGAKVVYEPAAGVFHRNHTPSTEKARGLKRDEIVERDSEKNKAYMCKKHQLDGVTWWE